MITSLANERIKFIRRLQERKARQESGLFFLEGLRLVAEALQVGTAVEQLVAAPDLLRSEFGQDLVARSRSTGVDVLEVSAEVFARLSNKEGPQGLAAVVHQRWVQLDQVQLNPGRPWVALDAVADPGNLGTIMRTNDAAGGDGVILLDHSTDPYDPSAVRASMGALFDQQIVRTGFNEFKVWKEQVGCAVVGTSDAAAQDYHAYSYPDPLVVLMGSERQGLQPQHLAVCDAVVSIPMSGKSDSLNLAVATGIILYEIFNQRRNRN